MATTKQLETIAARIFPEKSASNILLERTSFLSRVMSAGTWEETDLVAEHFGREALREVLNAPPAKIFDRESWAYWHVLFGLQTPIMPDNFFTVYPWFKDKNGPVQKDAVNLAHMPEIKTAKVYSVDESQQF